MNSLELETIRPSLFSHVRLSSDTLKQQEIEDRLSEFGLSNSRARIRFALKPKNRITRLQWRGTLLCIFLTSFISGYDVSNVANIQSRIYESLGDIELLEWIGLSFSLAIFSVSSYARKIVYCFDLKWLYLVHLIFFMIGSIVAGSAQQMASVIIGRTIMGASGAVIIHINSSYIAVYAEPSESPGIVALSSVSWATGLALGGPIGSAFADTARASWRWAFYFNAPLVGTVAVASVLCLPSYTFFLQTSPIMQRLKAIDPVGIILNALVPELFAIAITFSSPIWPWGSAHSIAIWLFFGLFLFLWILQQSMCIFTTKEERSLPLHMLSRRDMFPIWIASGCAGATYAIALIYTPLFFAFTRGYSALKQTVHLLPFSLTFIVTLMVSGRLLPVFRLYKAMYIAAGVLSLCASSALAATLRRPNTGTSIILGLEALLGIGLGLHFQHGLGISNAMNQDQKGRIDSAAWCNFALFGGIAITLAIAGSIFQNVGFVSLFDTLRDESFTDSEIRKALAGLSSFDASPAILVKVSTAISDVIGKELFLAVTASCICLVSALMMRNELLQF